MLVRDYMTRTVLTLNERSMLMDAAMIIRRTGKRHIPVLNDEGRLAGIVTDRDVARMAPSMLSHITPEEYNAVYESTPITMAMTAGPVTVTPETSMRDAVGLLYARKIGALPVVEGEALVGILTVTDALGLLDSLLSGTTESSSVSGAAPAEGPESVTP
ncbi:MAG TPA: CBS domain-containing protein [Terriglobales bacterium]|nr:CBS domain-containing protein [Terriglobales bacterium]